MNGAIIPLHHVLLCSLQFICNECYFLFVVCLLLYIVNGQGKHPAQTTSTSWSRALPVDGVKLLAFNMRKLSELV